MIKVYGMSGSGNCYKVKLMLNLLYLPFEWQEVDVLGGETQTDYFRAINPAGKVPVIKTEEGEILTESNAVLCYLAEGSEYLPESSLAKARVLQWLFWEQYSHEPYIAVARFIRKFAADPESRRQELERCMVKGQEALSVMEKQLGKQPYVAGPDYSIADVSLYGYTHVADEAGFDLKQYPAISHWLKRVVRHKRHVEME